MRRIYMLEAQSNIPAEFYCHCMEVLEEGGVPFLVGGAFALRAYTGIIRDTKDFDVMLRPADVERALTCLKNAGYDAEVVFSHWLAKAHHGESFIDIIYSSGNGLCVVDDAWFAAARAGTLMGRSVQLCPPEEIIWQKAYIMERERYDGADIAHLLLYCAEEIDWKRLMQRFGEDVHILLCHLLLFEFIYPHERHLIPAEVIDHLWQDSRYPVEVDRVCNGTLLSRAQYLPDIERWGYRDARVEDRHLLTPDQRRKWTSGISSDPHGGG